MLNRRQRFRILGGLAGGYRFRGLKSLRSFKGREDTNTPSARKPQRRCSMITKTHQEDKEEGHKALSSTCSMEQASTQDHGL